MAPGLQLIEQLFNLDLKTFNLILIAWGLLAVPSPLSIVWAKILPMSSRADNSKLAVLGAIDKRMGWIIMEVPVIATVLLCYCGGIKASGSTVNVSAVFVAVFVHNPRMRRRLEALEQRASALF